MDKILLVDPDPNHSSDLECALRLQNCRVSVCTEQLSAIQATTIQGVDLIVSVSRSRAMWRKELESFCGALYSLERRPAILCVLRWPPDGPDDRLFGDRLHVRVLHER